MLPAAPGDPPRPAHEEIMLTHPAELDHTQGLLLRCRQIANTSLGAIADGLFPKGFEQRRVVDVMIRLEEEAFLYRRHRVKTSRALELEAEPAEGVVDAEAEARL